MLIHHFKTVGIIVCHSQLC